MWMRRDHLDDENRPINPERRDALARIGYHVEPILIMPIGEIVNGALLQLLEIAEEGRNETDGVAVTDERNQQDER